MTDADDATKLAEIRGKLSLAAQVLYQCRVFQILREQPEDAARLLRDPIELGAVYRERFGE